MSRRGLVIAGLMLLVGGGAARGLDHLLAAADAAPLELPRPLSSLPLTLGDWKGTDLSLDERVVEVGGFSEHLSRRYVHADSGRSVELFVAYAARPAKMLSHRPQVCYPANGWNHQSTRVEPLTVPGFDGMEGLFHRFSRVEPAAEAAVVMNYYILQGRYLTDWREFWGPRWRLPNLSRDPRFYVIQVQFSTVGAGLVTETAEADIRELAARVAPHLDYLRQPTAADTGKP